MAPQQEKTSAKSWLLIGGVILFFPLLAAFVSFFPGKHKGDLSLRERYGVQGVTFESVKSGVSEALAEAKFPDENWDPMILEAFEEGPRLLSRDIDFKIASPPANTSSVTQAGLETMRRYAKYLRTPEQLALIHAENTMTRMHEPFEKVGMFTSANNKATVDLIDMAQIDLSYFVIKAKRDFARIRPNALAPDLELVFDNPPHPAYPSGHGSQGYMTALILSLVDPAHEAAYKAMGYDIGLRREIAGVHYPSDAIAGRKLAQAVLDKLLEVPAFQGQLEKARKNFVAADEDSIASYQPVDTNVGKEGGPAK